MARKAKITRRKKLRMKLRTTSWKRQRRDRQPQMQRLRVESRLHNSFCRNYNGSRYCNSSNNRDNHKVRVLRAFLSQTNRTRFLQPRRRTRV